MANLVLNFTPIEIIGDKIKAYSSTFESKEQLNNLRKQYQNCTFYRQGIEILCIPQNNEQKIGKELELEVSQNHKLICRLVLENLQTNLVSPNRKIISLSPFTFIDTTKDLIRESSFGEKLRGLHIYPKYSISVKSIKRNNGSTTFGIVIDVSAYFDTSYTIKDLIEKGLNLKNIYVVKKSVSKINDKDWIHKHTIGKIVSINDNLIKLSDYRESNSVVVSECYPEPRKDNFNFIIRSIVGPEYQNAKIEIQAKLLEYIGGVGKQNLTKSIIDEIKSISNKQISLELSFALQGEMMKIGDGFSLGLNQMPKPTYVYDPARKKTHYWHNGGLNSFGPFDLESFHKKTPRVVVITPMMYQGEVEKFLNSFRNGFPGKGYFQQGFVRKYHLNDMTIKFITFDYDPDDIANSYREVCLSALETTTYDLAFVIIEERFQNWSGDYDPYLVSKSIFMSHGVPVQEIEIETIRQGEWSWPYSLDNIALASYVKMGGTPWTISTYEPIYHELIIGMGNALISDSRLGSAKRYVGITNVFGSDGSYLLNNISKDIYKDNYKKEILEGLKSCIEYVAKRNAWQPGDNIRFIFHQQFKEYKDEDIEIIKEFVASLGDYNVQYAFVHLSEGHLYQIYDTDQNGVEHKFDKNPAYRGKTKGQLAPERGYVIQTSPRSVLLTLTGPNQLLTPFQGIPKPLQIYLHRDSTFTDINYIAKQIFHFTFLNWKGFNPTRIPVTISYSNLIASLLGRLKGISNWNPDIIRTQLRYSRWFL